MKKIITTIAVLAIIGYAAYAYATRPITPASQDINAVSSKLPAGSATSSVYKISQEKSLVTFEMNELLNNKPKLVVGTTTQVAGEIALKDGTIEFGGLAINAKSFITDSENRNKAIVNLILASNKPENEFITFTPASPDVSIELGKKAVFDLSGDLTISGVTKPATFKVELTATEDSITGKATTRIKRSDFNLVIPNFSFIANIDNEFPIMVEVVAERIMK
jgi:polyisoprenoid-binding protein YceI